ncbi:MAG: hypothetical protein ACE5IY_21705, partial [bacterium]
RLRQAGLLPARLEKTACEVKYTHQNIRRAQYQAFFAAYGQASLQVIYHAGQPPRIEGMTFLRF